MEILMFVKGMAYGSLTMVGLSIVMVVLKVVSRVRRDPSLLHWSTRDTSHV